MMIERSPSSPQIPSAENVATSEVGWEVVEPLSYLEIDGTKLACAERGSGDPVIFVHGALSDYRSWSPQLRSLSDKYRTIAYSRRFHYPELTAIPDQYSYRRHVDDLIALIEQLGLDHVNLVGHSYGATVAALVAAERPELVRSLVLGEPGLFSILSDASDLVSLRLFRIALNVVQKLAEVGEQDTAVRQYLNIVVGEKAFDYLPMERLLVVRQNAHTLGPMLETLFEFQGTDAVVKTRVPTLTVAGESSPAIHRSICRQVQKSLSKGELVNLGNASHGLHLENPIDFNYLLRDFISRDHGIPTEQQSEQQS
jgi:non-heme chloroperoxidase